MNIHLTPKQHLTLSLAADPCGTDIARSAWPTRNYLSSRDLIQQTENGGTHYTATEKGRAVLNVIETGEVTVFETK